MDGFGRMADIKLKPIDKYPDAVRKWADGYFKRLDLDEAKLPEGVKSLIKRAANDVARRVYHLAVLSVVSTGQVNKYGATIQTYRSAPRGTPLIRALQARHDEKFKGNGLQDPGWTPQERREEFFEKRFKRAIRFVEEGFVLPLSKDSEGGFDGVKVPGIGDTEEMKKALVQQWRRKKQFDVEDTVFSDPKIVRYKTPHNFFWRALEHYRNSKRYEHLHELAPESVAPLPTVVLGDVEPPEGPIMQGNKLWEVGLLDRQTHVDEEGVLQYHCSSSINTMELMPGKYGYVGRKRRYIFSLYHPLENPVRLEDVIDVEDNMYYQKYSLWYEQLYTQREPLATIEYDAKSGCISQISLKGNEQLQTLDWEGTKAVFQALRRIRAYVLAEGMEFRGAVGGFDEIDSEDGCITIDGKVKDVGALDVGDVVLRGDTLAVPVDMTPERFAQLATIPGIDFDITLWRDDLPRLFSQTDVVEGGIEGVFDEGDERVEKLVFDVRHCKGSVEVSDLKEVGTLVLPRAVNKNVVFTNLEHVRRLWSPEYVGGEFDMNELVGTPAIQLPDYVGGDVFMNSIVSLEGTVMSGYVGGNIYLNGLQTSKGFSLPRGFSGMVSASSLPAEEVALLKRRYPMVSFCGTVMVV